MVALRIHQTRTASDPAESPIGCKRQVYPLVPPDMRQCSLGPPSRTEWTSGIPSAIDLTCSAGRLCQCSIRRYRPRRHRLRQDFSKIGLHKLRAASLLVESG
jgi:hypothetical protein